MFVTRNAFQHLVGWLPTTPSSGAAGGKSFQGKEMMPSNSYGESLMLCGWGAYSGFKMIDMRILDWLSDLNMFPVARENT